MLTFLKTISLFDHSVPLSLRYFLNFFFPGADALWNFYAHHSHSVHGGGPDYYCWPMCIVCVCVCGGGGGGGGGRYIGIGTFRCYDLRNSRRSSYPYIVPNIPHTRSPLVLGGGGEGQASLAWVFFLTGEGTRFYQRGMSPLNEPEPITL